MGGVESGKGWRYEARCNDELAAQYLYEEESKRQKIDRDSDKWNSFSLVWGGFGGRGMGYYESIEDKETEGSHSAKFLG